MLFLWLASLPVILAALVNVTIDNKFGDPTTGAQFSYSPNGAWFDEPGCQTCSAHPDPALAYDGTWIEGTFSSQPNVNAFPNIVLTASVNFTGQLLQSSAVCNFLKYFIHRYRGLCILYPCRFVQSRWIFGLDVLGGWCSSGNVYSLSERISNL
jgi:hypothetical protein